MAGALLAAGIAASLLAARIRLPGLLLFLGLGMAIGSDGLDWIDFRDYELARTIGIVALALILFEGGLTAGFDEIRPVLRPARQPRPCRHVRDGGDHRAGGDLAVRPEHSRGAAARLDHLLDGRRGDLRSAARVHAAAQAGSDAGGRVRLQRPRGDPARARLHRLDKKPGLRRRRHGLLFAQEMAIGAAVGVAVGLLAVRGLQRTRIDTAGLYPVATLATAAIAFGGADTLARLGLPRLRTWRGWRSAPRASRPSAP